MEREIQSCCFSDVTYHIAVKTGDVSGGSSDSKVFVKFYGERGDTSRMMLVVSDNNLRNYFETGRVDIFSVDTCDIGQVRVLHAVFCDVCETTETSFCFSDQSPHDRSHQRRDARRLVSGQCSDYGAQSWQTLHVPQSPLAVQR